MHFPGKMVRVKILFLLVSILVATQAIEENYITERNFKSDLETGATGKLLLSSLLFNKIPSYGNRYNPSGNYPSGGYYPNSGGYYPSSGGHYPSSGGYYPSSGGYNPSSGGYNPSSGGYYPSSGGFYPSSGYYPSSGQFPSSGHYPNSGYNPSGSSGGYYPTNSGGYYPGGGTNVLGGGFGGYGGYGGNAGLTSYSGYYDRGYNGKRNLGFGYYSHTNDLGFIRERNSFPEQVSGYRGYH